MGRRDAVDKVRMNVRISGLSDGEHPFEFTADSVELELPDFHGSVIVTGSVRKVRQRYVITGNASGNYKRFCDRCLIEASHVLTGEFALYYSDADEVSSDEPEQRIVGVDQSVIALDDDVREVLLIEVPLKFVCKDDCKGLCPTCGADLNLEQCHCETNTVDARWAKLAGLIQPEDLKSTNN